MSAKLATLDLVKIKLFWNNCYDVIIFLHDVSDNIWSRDLSWITEVVMGQKFGNSIISITEVIILQFYKDLTRKTNFLEGCTWFKLNNLWLALGMTLKFYSSVIERLKLKVRKFWGPIPLLVTGEKLVGETF